MIHHEVFAFNERIVKMINTLFFVLCLVTSSTGYTIDSTHSTLKEDSELKRQPKVINVFTHIFYWWFNLIFIFNKKI